MKFEKYNFHPRIQKNLVKMDFKRPTDIQYKSITPILARQDILAVANTGTGKTVAYALPVLELLLRQKTSFQKKQIRCVVMVPTHELAIQVEEVINNLAESTGINTTAIYGGSNQTPQIEALKEGTDIIIATPGRLFDLKSQGYIHLTYVDILVLDEADHMLQLGFKKDMFDLIKNFPKKPQTLFFSATINPYVKKTAYSLVNKPVRIHISPKDPVSKNINHSVAFIEMDDKRFFLERIVRENQDKKILVFVRTKVRAERVMKAMERVNIKSQTIHSDKDQKTRNQTMSMFRSGENKILIATDVSARGIDIPNVEIVVNYDLPEEAENYVHRVGRTGRGTQKGSAVSFCSTQEKETLKKIEEFLDKSIARILFDKTEYETTIDLSIDNPNDWQSLLEEDIFPEKKKKGKKKS